MVYRVRSIPDHADFNPRSHKRSDKSMLSLLNRIPISIHAPTRGATLLVYHLHSIRLHFNPRSHKRSDLCRQQAAERRNIFQSTLPQEERPIAFRLSVSPSLFQSTLPQEERRSAPPCCGPPWQISIHAPTRGATTIRHMRCRRLSYFNPRSHKRSDGLHLSP